MSTSTNSRAPSTIPAGRFPAFAPPCLRLHIPPTHSSNGQILLAIFSGSPTTVHYHRCVPLVCFCSLTGPDLCPLQEYPIYLPTCASYIPRACRCGFRTPRLSRRHRCFPPLPWCPPPLHYITCAARQQRYPVPCLTGITKLADTNNAGTCNAYRFMLILTEGDSAKALTMAGLGVARYVTSLLWPAQLCSSESRNEQKFRRSRLLLAHDDSHDPIQLDAGRVGRRP